MSLSDFQTSYQVSPIVLVGGVAGTGVLPIVSLLNPNAYSQGLASSANPQPISTYFGQFRPIPGKTLMDNEVATYPVANQATAGNAVITNGLHFSIEMITPAGGAITLSNRQTIITALKSTLDSHTALGGWYNVAFPSYIYQGALLLTLVDETDEVEGGQTEVRWVWNFYQPLITVAAAQAAQNTAMGKIAGQTANAGDPPGSQPVASGISNPTANIAPALVPAATNPVGTNIVPPGTPTGTPSASAVSPISPGG